MPQHGAEDRMTDHLTHDDARRVMNRGQWPLRRSGWMGSISASVGHNCILICAAAKPCRRTDASGTARTTRRTPRRSPGASPSPTSRHGPLEPPSGRAGGCRRSQSRSLAASAGAAGGGRDRSAAALTPGSMVVRFWIRTVSLHYNKPTRRRPTPAPGIRCADRPSAATETREATASAATATAKSAPSPGFPAAGAAARRQASIASPNASHAATRAMDARTSGAPSAWWQPHDVTRASHPAAVTRRP